jgi:DNA-binding transcriptional MerR regulator
MSALDSSVMGELGAEELAERAGITVALLRSYQSKGLLPPPRRMGRAALYDDRHLERLRDIAELKSRGYSLRSIAEHFDPPRRTEPTSPEALRLRDVAARSGVPVEMLRSWQASGLIRPRHEADGAVYDQTDVMAARSILLLVGSGIPFDRFLEVARLQIDASVELAHGALGLFEEHVASRLDADDPATRDAAFAEMVEAIGRMAAYVVVRQVRDADAAADAD